MARPSSACWRLSGVSAGIHPAEQPGPLQKVCTKEQRLTLRNLNDWDLLFFDVWWFGGVLGVFGFFFKYLFVPVSSVMWMHFSI